MHDAPGSVREEHENSLFVHDPSFDQASVAYSHSGSSNGPQAFGSVMGSNDGNGSNNGGAVPRSDESSLFVRSEYAVDLTGDTDTE